MLNVFWLECLKLYGKEVSISGLTVCFPPKCYVAPDSWLKNTSVLEVRVSAGASCLLCHGLQLDFSIIKEFSHVNFCKGH